VEVVGVSGDAVIGQEIFKKVNNLNFTLLSDSDGAIAKKFGVPTKKGGPAKYKFEGKEYQWERGAIPARWTFIIDQKGNVVYKDTKVSAVEDSKKIREEVKKLKAS
jgi:thioredoxin-dependent peroxiredoxin